jgi:2-phospho-L-lactate guanylyltransferase
LKTVAVVPVKNLQEAKSRLADTLAPQERTSLTLDMVARVLDAITSSGVVAEVAVITPPQSLHLPPGMHRVEQVGSGLNNALEQGREWAINQQADALLVVLGDLPLLSAGDIRAICELGQSARTVVLAADRHGRGTNAMLSHPPSLARFIFGRDSFPKHRLAAQRAGAEVLEYSSDGTLLDVDTPDDLSRFMGGSPLQEPELASHAPGGPEPASVTMCGGA